MRKALACILTVLLSAVLSAAPVKREAAGQPRYLVVLVEFKDLSFTVGQPAEAFSERFNASGASVRSYFSDNSLGRYVPDFDVVGPVRLEKNVSAYGRDVMENGVRTGDLAPEKALFDACTLLDADVDFSRYDQDADGKADLILVVFAGYDQAEGGPSQTLWSHQWDASDTDYPEVAGALFDGVRLGPCVFVSELRGKSGSQMSGIGPACHEIGHFLGLPDFYDTDGAVSGNAGGVYGFSLMGQGLYNNGGDTPPYMNLLEKSILGWVEEEIPLLPDGIVSLGPVQEGKAFRSLTGTEGEYFLYEYRGSTGWDAALPEGLLIYHVDQSDRLVGGVPASGLWWDWRPRNAVNASAEHPCYYAIPSADVRALAFDATMAAGNIVFPGLGKLIYYEPVDWEGEYTGVQITNISLSGGAANFHVLTGAQANINGIVRDAGGEPLADVEVSLEGIDSAATRSEEDGFFRLDIPQDADEKIFSLSASRHGFRPQTVEVALNDHRMMSVPIELRREGQADSFPLFKYDRHASMGYFSQTGVLCAVRFTVQDLAPYVGQRLSEISFYPYLQQGFEDDVYVTVDFGDRRVLNRLVEPLAVGPYFQNSVDISDADLVIPEGVEIYIGYGSASSSPLFYAGTVYPAAKGNSFYSPFSLDRSSWKDLYVKSAGIYMDVALSGVVSEVMDVQDLGQLGYHYIQPGSGTYKAGERFPLELSESSHAALSSVSWYYDDAAVNASSVVLTEGTHTVQARLKYRDGREEILELSLKVN